MDSKRPLIFLPLCLVCSQLLAQDYELLPPPSPGQRVNTTKVEASGIPAGKIPNGARQALSHLSFALINSEKWCGSPLIISNVPYGVWLEISGSHYFHSATRGLMHVAVDGFTYTGTGPYGIKISTRPSKANKSPRRERNLQLVPGKQVVFDWTREFGSRPFDTEEPTEIKPMKPARSTSTTTPIITPIAKPPSITLEMADDLSFFRLQRTDVFYEVKVDVGNAARTITIPEITGGADTNKDSATVFAITGPEDRLKTTIATCKLSGKVDIKFTDAGGNPSELKDQVFEVELKLEGSAKIPGGINPAVLVSLDRTKLEAAIVKHTGIAPLIRKQVPGLPTEKNELLFVFHADSKVQFDNGLLGTGNPVKFDINEAPEINIRVTSK